MPPGWYYATGDPADTQRFWDGATWRGDPQPANSSGLSATGPSTGGVGPLVPPFEMPPRPQTDYPQTAYGHPPGSAADGMGGPGGSAGPTSGMAGSRVVTGAVPCEFGDRAAAFLVDVGPLVALFVVAFFVRGIVGIVSETLGLLVIFAASLVALGYCVWNFGMRQGETGQSLGKQRQGIRLVADSTGEPVGIGMALVRWFAVGATVGFLNLISCGILGSLAWMLDLASPLWQPERKRFTDNLWKFSVVKG